MRQLVQLKFAPKRFSERFVMSGKKGYPYSMVWIWKGVTLKKDQDVTAMKVVTEAIEFQKNISNPEDKLIIPSDVKVKVLEPLELSGG